MSDNRKKDQNNDNNSDNGSNLFGWVVAGIGIGAALYGVSKLFSSEGSSNKEPEREFVQGDYGVRRPERVLHYDAKRPSLIDVIETEHECVRAINRIER